MTNPLHAFFDSRQPSDRGIWKWHHYFDVYHRHLAHFQRRPITMVEIGVLGGGSLDMWHWYFNDPAKRDVAILPAHIHGVDIDPACDRFQRYEKSIQVHIGDATDDVFWASFKVRVPHLDIVIDDGGHEAHQQAAAFNALFTHLQPGGVYIVEDMEPNAFLQQVLQMAWAIQPTEILRSDDPARSLVIKATPLHEQVASVHVYPGMVVIEKAAAKVTEFVAERRGSW